MDAGTVISIFIGALLAVFSVSLVGYSLFRGPGPQAASQENTGPESATPEGDGLALGDIFDAIRTLELERQLDRVTQEEFQAQFQAYRVQAATVLRDQLESGRGDPAWALEQEILLARDAQAGRATAGHETTIPCPNCNAAVPSGLSDCHECGAAMATQS